MSAPLRTPLSERVLARSTLVALALGSAISTAFAQGALTPPGAPAPTMKSLDQISTQLTSADAKSEARIAVETLSGDASAKYVISQPGSYYLRGNISVVTAGQTAIRINAIGVTLDLNGFSVSGPGASSTANGISASVPRATVRNGTVSGFNSGVALNTHSAVYELAVTDVVNTGVIATGTNGLVSNVTVNLAGAVGISAALVEHCTVSNVSSATLITSKFGIDAQIARGCQVSAVSSTGVTDAYGIRGRILESCRSTAINSERYSYGVFGTNDDTSAIRDCVAQSITATSGAYGLYGASIQGSSVTSVTASAGSAYGIVGNVANGCSAENITAEGTGDSALGIVAQIVRDCRISNVDTLDHISYGIQATSVSGCVVSGIATGGATGTGIGIALNSFSSATFNSVSACRSIGIRVNNSGMVQHNTISAVGIAAGIADGAHVYVNGNDNNIEDNLVVGSTGSDYGIRVITSRNLVVRNRATGTFGGIGTGAGGIDTSEFNIIAGNRFGPIAVWAATGEITATNPHANFAD